MHQFTSIEFKLGFAKPKGRKFSAANPRSEYSSIQPVYSQKSCTFWKYMLRVKNQICNMWVYIDSRLLPDVKRIIHHYWLSRKKNYNSILWRVLKPTFPSTPFLLLFWHFLLKSKIIKILIGTWKATTIGRLKVMLLYPDWYFEVSFMCIKNKIREERLFGSQSILYRSGQKIMSFLTLKISF